MKLNKKKGFTIVELVIVIAIIAILAAVLIPTFASLIRKANESADIQAVRQMNTYLAVNEVTADKSILEVYKTLANGGMSAKDYHPLVSDRYFFWDSKLNRIVYTDAGYKVLFPEDSTANQGNGWYSLTQEIKEEDYTNNEGTIEITKAGQLAKLSKDLETNKIQANKKLTIKIANNIDMMGASFHIDATESCEISLTADSAVTITGLVNTSYANMVLNNVGKETNYHNQVIKIAKTASNSKVTITNITFKGMSLGNDKSSDVSLVSVPCGVASKNNSVNLENVHITDSTFMGTYRVAGFFAHTDATVTMNNCSIENSTLTASVGAVAPIFSMLTNKGTFTDVTSKNNTVTCTNTDSVKLDSLTVSFNNKSYEVKLPADGVMTKQPDSNSYRWYPAKSAFGIYGATINTNGGTVTDNNYPLASGGLDCVETIEDANSYEFNTNRK